MAKDTPEDMELKAEIAFNRAQATHTPRDEALAIIHRLLTESPNGYFTWTPLSDDNVWWFRHPKLEAKEVKQWLNGNETHVIHICDPVRYVDSAKRGNFRELVNFSGYVCNTRDESKRDDDDRLPIGMCMICKTEMPPGMSERIDRQTRVWRFMEKMGDS